MFTVFTFDSLFLLELQVHSFCSDSWCLAIGQFSLVRSNGNTYFQASSHFSLLFHFLATCVSFHIGCQDVPLSKVNSCVFFTCHFCWNHTQVFSCASENPRTIIVLSFFHLSFPFLLFPTSSLSAYLMVALYKEIIKNKLAVGDWWKLTRNLYTEARSGFLLSQKVCDPARGSPLTACHSIWTESQFPNLRFHSFVVALKTLCSKQGSQFKTVLLLQWMT